MEELSKSEFEEGPLSPEQSEQEKVRDKVIEWTEKGKKWLAKLWRKTEEAPREVLEEIETASEKKGLVIEEESLGGVEQQKSQIEKKLDIPGLSSDFTVEDFPGDPKPSLIDDFKFLITGARWDLSAREQGGKVCIDIKPKVSKRVKEIGGRFIDEAIIQTDEEGKLELKPDSGYSAKLPLCYQEGLIHRGVYSGEMADILENGRIKTRGDAVKNIGGHEGLTFFTELPDLAEGYATKAGRVQGAYYPSFDRPNYILTIKKPAEVAFKGDSGEIGISQDVPLSDIEAIIEVRPYEITAGVIPLETNANRIRPSRGVEAWQNPLQLNVAYREVSVDELRTSLLAQQTETIEH